MLTSECLCARSPTDNRAENQVSRVEVTFWANPALFADYEAAVDLTMQHGMVANEDTVTDVKGLWMTDGNSAAYSHAVAKFLAKRAHDDPPFSRCRSTRSNGIK